MDYYDDYYDDNNSLVTNAYYPEKSLVDGEHHENSITAKEVLLSIICGFGLIGNMISIFVIVVLKEYKKSTLHLYVLQLAIADTIFLSALPFLIKQDRAGQWIFSESACKARESIVFLNYYASVFFLMIMSVDRYIAVCHPFSSRLMKLRKPFTASVVIVATWLLSVLACIPSISYAKVIGIEPTCKCSYLFPCDEPPCPEPKCMSYEDIFGDGGSDYDYSGNETYSYNYEEKENQTVRTEALVEEDTIAEACHYFHQPRSWYTFLYINFSLLFVLPVLVMVITYGFIIRRMHKTEARTMKQRSSSRTSATATDFTRRSSRISSFKGRPGMSVNKRVTIMCSTLVASFAALWLPYHAVHLAKIGGIKLPESKGYICDHLTAAGTVMGYLNSALNPYFYSFIGTNFSRRFRSARHTIRKSIHSTENSKGRTAAFTKGKGSESGGYNVTLITRDHRSGGGSKKTSFGENSMVVNQTQQITPVGTGTVL